jgi:hypothetical protein
MLHSFRCGAIPKGTAMLHLTVRKRSNKTIIRLNIFWVAFSVEFPSRREANQH